MEDQKLEKNVQEQENTENPMIKKRWFGRGIYGSKDVPIRLLDGFIGVIIAVIILMIVFFAVRGGFWITFDSQGEFGRKAEGKTWGNDCRTGRAGKTRICI